MKIFLSMILIFLTSCTGGSTSDFTAHKDSSSYHLSLLIEPDAGRKAIIDTINHASEEIDGTMYLFTDKKIAQALYFAAKRGVKVRFLLEKSPYEYPDANQKLIQFWKASSIHWHSVPQENPMPQFNLYHAKSLIIDHKELWIMTLNFTYHSFSHKNFQRNFIIVDKDKQDIKIVENIFSHDWQYKLQPLKFSAGSTVLASPENMAQSLFDLLLSAKKNIEIYAAGLNNKKFMHILAQKAKEGVNIKIIYSEGLTEYDKKYLLGHDVHLYPLSQNHENHAKVIIVDNKIAYVGSANFTTASLYKNRELGLLIQDQSTIKDLTQQFLKDENLSVKK